jgi:uncharacterized protein (TIGR04255 family)
MIETLPNFDKAKRNKSYPNSTIAEALCEIHFDCDPVQNPIPDTILKTLKTELSSDYPSVTEQQIKQFQAAITEMGISVDESKFNTTRLIFKHRERNHMVQFLPNILTINEVKQYPGWNLFLQDVSRGWAALNTGFPSIFPKRIGLRYINLIPRRNPLEPLSAWLKPSGYYPNAILNSCTGFLARNEFNLQKNVRLIVTLSEPIQNAQGNIIFDIDVISFLEDEIIDWRVINDHLEKLHNLVWDVFSTSLSQKFETLLNGELL